MQNKEGNKWCFISVSIKCCRVGQEVGGAFLGKLLDAPHTRGKAMGSFRPRDTGKRPRQLVGNEKGDVWGIIYNITALWTPCPSWWTIPGWLHRPFMPQFPPQRNNLKDFGYPSFSSPQLHQTPSLSLSSRLTELNQQIPLPNTIAPPSVINSGL